jgi:hypothetical protein
MDWITGTLDLITYDEGYKASFLNETTWRYDKVF